MPWFRPGIESARRNGIIQSSGVGKALAWFRTSRGPQNPLGFSEQFCHLVGVRLALFEPDIPQNAATMIRMAACLGVAVDLIEPCGFLISDRHFRRAGMDYLDRASIHRYSSWNAYLSRVRSRNHGARLVVLSTRAETAYAAFSFRADDTLLVGRESSGLPDYVHAVVDARVRVPMIPGNRSLNVAIAAAMVLGEALRQTNGLPEAIP